VKDILSLENIGLTYHTKNGEIKALENLSFNVKEEEFIAIVGPSGCGKTTILSLIAGLLKPSQGKILMNGEENYHTKENIGYMFQRDHLFEWRTVYKNITLGIEIQNKKTNEEMNAHINKLLTDYGLINFKDNYPRQLSGGMRQRVALIRTLALNPSLLLLDEPFSALDYQTRLAVSDDVYEIIKKEKKTALLVTHDISEAISMADRVIILTQRPAKVKQIFEMNLKQYGSPLKRRESEGFHLVFDKIWEALQHEK
jgi:NitT/TauT family transport system ATP-binding protein